MRMDAVHTRQTLVFDADDTLLWENNVLFERVVERYLDWVAHPTLGRAAVRAVLVGHHIVSARPVVYHEPAVCPCPRGRQGHGRFTRPLRRDVVLDGNVAPRAGQ